MSFLVGFFKVLTAIIIADAILSWFQTEDKFPRNLTTRITDPLYRPIRAIVSPDKTGGIDFSPLIVILLLQMIGQALAGSTIGF